jgi:hypothetical protein
MTPRDTASGGLIARAGIVAGVAGFWAAAAVAARSEPGYDGRTDYLSALASIGAAEPAPGVVMFACGAGVLVAAAAVVRRVQPDAVPVPGLLLVAAVCVTVAGVARVTCLEGAAGCNAGPLVVEQTTPASRFHATAVGGYQLAFSLAMAVLGETARRRGRRALAVLGWGAAVLTPVLAFNPLGLDAGTAQRVWVAAGHLPLLAVAGWRAASPSDGSGG